MNSRIPTALANASRRGLTLVELLIVISIAVVLLAVAIPLAKQPLEQQKLRGASRQLNSLIASAQARAVELNRPVGLIFEIRDIGDVIDQSGLDAINATEGITRVHFAEVPPLYGGDVSGAQVVVIRDVNDGFYYAHFDQRSYAGVQSFVRAGELIRFGYRGRWFPVTTAPQVITAGVEIRVRITVVNASEISQNRPIQFQIKRRPQKSIRPPIDLPDDIVIDLVGSGVGNSTTNFGVWFDAPNNTWQRFGFPYVMLMFQPSGAIDQIYYGPVAKRPGGPIHFLVGRADQVLPTAPFTSSNDDLANLRDPEALWVSIGHTTGRVTTTENLPTDDFVVDPNSSFTAAQQRVLLARSLAMSSQSKGGR